MRRLKHNIEHMSKMLGSAFPSKNSNTRGDLAFRLSLLSLMIGPTERRGFGLGEAKRLAGGKDG